MTHPGVSSFLKIVPTFKTEKVLSPVFSKRKNPGSATVVCMFMG